MLPAGVRDDDLVGHGLQAVVDDHHLQRLVGGQVPQGSCGKEGRKKKKRGLGREMGRLKESQDKGARNDGGDTQSEKRGEEDVGGIE